MPLNPLTHHEILGLVEPFARRGLHPDLAATNRVERRIVFKAIEHGDALPGLEGLRERLELDVGRPGAACRLTRTLALPCGLEARLEAHGVQPANLLARIEAIPLQRQFRWGEGFVVAESHRLAPTPHVGAPEGSPDGDDGDSGEGASPHEMILTRGAAQVAGLAVALTMPATRGYSAEIELTAKDGDDIELTEDMLAVLGWSWGSLSRFRNTWKGTLRPRGREPARSRAAEGMFAEALAHLARTLSEPPRRFHERMARARWSAAFRRAIPLLGGLALVAAAFGVALLDIAPDSGIAVLLFHSPPLLLVAFFCIPETPRIEVPPLPRALRAPAWRRSLPDDADTPASPAAQST